MLKSKSNVLRFQLSKVKSSLIKDFRDNIEKATRIGGIAIIVALPFNVLADVNSSYVQNGTPGVGKPVIMGSVGDTPSQASVTQGGGGISAVTGLVITGLCCSSNGTGCSYSTSTSFGMFSDPSVDVSTTKVIGKNYLYNLLGSALAASGLNSPTSICTYLANECGCGLARYVRICATNSAAQYTGGVTTKGCMAVSVCTSCTDNNGSTGGTWDPGNVGITTTA